MFAYRRERVKNIVEKPVMRDDRIETMNNTGFRAARKAAGLAGVRVHDLRHRFGQRLREAGVQAEDRALLLGHALEGMPQHYAKARIARLVALAKVTETRVHVTLLRVING